MLDKELLEFIANLPTDVSPDHALLKDLLQRISEETMYYDMTIETRMLLVDAIGTVGLAIHDPRLMALLEGYFQVYRKVVCKMVGVNDAP